MLLKRFLSPFMNISHTFRQDNLSVTNMRRIFQQKAIQHIYQHSVDWGVIFYTNSDRLVYYTLASVKSKKHDVRIFAAAIMFTHTHQSAQAISYSVLYRYLHDLDTSFARLYNARYHRKGKLFGRPPGYAQKVTLKAMKSNLVYVFNNHVEKGLCKRAVEERWSLLAYALSDHPFSPQIQRGDVSRALRRALKLVDRRIAANKALEYCDLDGIFSRLDPVETQQFIDYVISRYRLVDFGGTIAYFGSIENLLITVDSTTGGEYDIKEDYSRDKDCGYVALLQDSEVVEQLPNVFSMQDDLLLGMVSRLARSSVASPSQLRRFFHLRNDE